MAKKPEKPRREMTKRQISHWQKENRIQRILMIVGAVVIAAVLIVIGTGLYTNQYRPLNAVVIKVGDKEYKMDYYIDALAYYGSLDYSTYSGYFDYQTYLSYIAGTIAQRIEFNTMVTDSAMDLNPPVSVSDDEVNKTIKDRGYKSNAAIFAAIRSELLQIELRDQYFETLVPDSAEQRAVLAMFLESQAKVDEIKARVEAGESFKDIAKDISREGISKSKDGDFGWIPEGILPALYGEPSGKLIEDEIFTIDINTLSSFEDENQSKDFGYWILKVTETRDVTSTPTPTPTETGTPTPTPVITPQKHLYGILLGNLEKAQEIKAKLDAGGEGNDFESLAKANSEYPDAATNGGELGWKSKGDMGEAVDAVIFPDDQLQALGLNQISDPISETGYSTEGGFWLVEITGIDTDKQITGDNRSILVSVQQDSWGQKLWDDNIDNMEILLTPDQQSYAITKASSIR